MKNLFFILITGLFSTLSFSQKTTKSDSIQWFADAKLGIFIHWGIYAVDGTSESWAFHNKGVPYPTYMSQLNGFKAENYQPEEWAKLIKESGAQYTVMTTQHHDGVALWDTKLKTPHTKAPQFGWALPTLTKKYEENLLWKEKLPLSVVYQTPAKRDLITPFVEAVRKEGLHFGAYYSLLDWSHGRLSNFSKRLQPLSNKRRQCSMVSFFILHARTNSRNQSAVYT